MATILEKQKREAIENLCFEGIYKEDMLWGNGHINDTYLLIYESEKKEPKRYILQRMNKRIFTKPMELMENVVGVTSYLRKIIIENGGDPDRETLNVIPAKNGESYFVDSAGE